MTASRIGISPRHRSLPALLRAGRLQQKATRAQTLFDLDSQPAASPGRGPGTWPDGTAGSAAGMQRWSGEWSGDQLTRAEPLVDHTCTDETGSPCPKFAEARARQALAEHQLTEFNHRLVNMLQMLAIRIERQQRLQDVPARREELGRLVASIHASGQLQRHLLPPRKNLHVDLALVLGNVATAIEGITGLFCEVDTDPVNVPGRIATNLAAAVTELALNAPKHAYDGAEGGVIRIVCRRDADARLRLSVADQGCGLPAKFDPRVSEGLGLMVVCATLRQFNGKLQVTSDQGACFTMLLDIPVFEGPG